MHKLILEFENFDQLQQATADLNKPEGLYHCQNRLQLLKEMRDLYRMAFMRGSEPTLTELKTVIWKFVS